MKIPPAPHPWPVTPAEAIALQRELAIAVDRRPLLVPPRLVAGLDAAFPPDGRCLAAVVLWDLQAQEVVEEHTTREETILEMLRRALEDKKRGQRLAQAPQLPG